MAVNHSTAWHALAEVARMQSGETVLIHSGAGGTGQAAIQIAHHLGAGVFTTVITAEKRDFLAKRYDVPLENIFSSRDTVFLQSIKRLTSGRGVDVVLNSLSGEGLAASWECIALHGRFLEIGKRDIYEYNKLQMFHFARNVTFSAIDLAAMTIERPERTVNAFKMILNLVEKGRLTTSEPMQVYGIGELEKAFCNMQGEEFWKGSDRTVLDTKPSLRLIPEATYVIAGGFGGLGRNRPEAKGLIEDLRAREVCMRAPACDISDSNALQAVLAHCLSDMPSIKGCIQASMVLKDGTFQDMTFEAWNAAILPKVKGTWNLHRFLPKNLDFFVMLSSGAGIIGSRGQANYAAGNTFQDALAKYRVANGEKAISLDLDAFLDGIILKNDSKLRGKFRISSLLGLVEMPELFALLEHFCNAEMSSYSLTSCQTTVGLGITSAQRENMDLVYWLNKPLFRNILLGTSENETTIKKVDGFDFKSIFEMSESLDEAVTVVTDALVAKLARILLLKKETIQITKPMHTYGVDCLVAVELRSWFLKEVRAEIAIFDILGSATIADIATLASVKSRYRKEHWKQ